VIRKTAPELMTHAVLEECLLSEPEKGLSVIAREIVYPDKESEQ
jgi:hypothetical protein